MYSKWIRYGLIWSLLSGLISNAAFCAEDVDVMVSRGDTIVDIAKTYLENPDDWRQIANANPLIRDPDRIYPGRKVRIPARLLKGIPCNGEISFMKGSVEILRSNTEGWVPLTPQDRLSEGYRVRTGDDGGLEIAFEDDSSFIMRSNTCLSLVKTRKSGAGSIIGDIFLEMGRIITHIRKATGREPRFRIGTPSAVASVRGTDFRVSHDTADSARVEVLSGIVETKGERRKVKLYEGEGTLIQKGKDPEKPRELLPPPSVVDPEPLYRKMPLEFRLETISGAVFSRLALCADPELKNIIYETSARPGEKAGMTDINDGTYHLQTTSVDDRGLEGAPKVTPISVRIHPQPPFIQSPQAGKEYKTTAMEFSWLNVADAVGYRLQIARDPEFEAIEDEQEVGTEPAYKTDRLEPGVYYFRILSKASDGYLGLYSDTVQFILLPPPPAPDSAPPKVGRKEISILWQSSRTGYTYRFQMSADKDFKEPLIDEQAKEPQFTFEKPRKAGIYYVRVKAVDPTGFEGRYAPAQSFAVKRFPWEWLGGAAAAIGTIVGIILL